MGGRDVIDGLRRMQQSTAILIDGDKEITVDAKTLKVGQKILVKPGAGIPIDGVVINWKRGTVPHYSATQRQHLVSFCLS